MRSLPGLDALRDATGATDAAEGRGFVELRVPRERRPDALEGLRGLGLTYYVFCGAVDWIEEGRFEVLDMVGFPELPGRVVLRCDVPRDEPTCPSAVGVFRGANWYERETWELFGIVFDGHPGLVRLFLSDWIEGFPLRKDYALTARVEKPWPGASFEG